MHVLDDGETVTITRCRTCLYPTTKPDLHFEDGECAACRNARNKPQIDWAERYQGLVNILADARPNEDGFNCIVPSSGGKDSTAQVLTLIDMGAKPLIVTASTCYLTPMGRANIDNLARYAPTIEYNPNWVTRAKLNTLGLEMVGDISWPEHAAIFSVPFRAAIENDIPLVFYGENPQREYGGPLGAHEALAMTKRWVSEFGGLLGVRPNDFVGLSGISGEDMDYYRLPDDTAMADVQAYFLGQFLPWNSRFNAQKAIAAGLTYALPCEASWWPWENLDNAMTGLHDHGMYRKYGYGRLAGQMSVDIRNGDLPRFYGLEMAKRRDGLFPWTYAGVRVQDVLDHLGQSMSWLTEHLDAHTSWNLFDGIEALRPLLKQETAVAAE